MDIKYDNQKNNDTNKDKDKEPLELEKLPPIVIRLNEEVSRLVEFVNNRMLLRGTDLKEIEFVNFFCSNGSYEKALALTKLQKDSNRWVITHYKPSFFYQWHRFKFKMIITTNRTGWFY